MVYSLQTGMRGAYGKPYGKVARVDIGQPLLSVRVKDANKAEVIEALRRSKFKFPGRQIIVVSKKWGFTKWDRPDFEKGLAEGTIVPDGNNAQAKNNHGPLADWKARKEASA